MIRGKEKCKAMEGEVMVMGGPDRTAMEVAGEETVRTSASAMAIE